MVGLQSSQKGKMASFNDELFNTGQLQQTLDARLVGRVVKVSASRAEDSEFESRLNRDLSGSSHSSDLQIGTPVATLPGAWYYRVSPGTGRPGVSIL